jgi:WD40 repeat protein
VRGVAFSPDGKRLATTCWDRLVRVWDFGSGAEKVTCTGHTDRVFSVDFSPDGKLLLSTGVNDGAKVWVAATGKEKQALMAMSHYFVSCARLFAHGGWVLTGSSDCAARRWHVKTGELRAYASGEPRCSLTLTSAGRRSVATRQTKIA